jgi:hypothetical protein
VWADGLEKVIFRTNWHLRQVDPAVPGCSPVILAVVEAEVRLYR